ncbi:hypothetical protein [Streptomyces sp. NPDC051776]|uniref:hypothetical protein n=1 Tax=Streptomyces sp. NPDC051776 TaxID=3155414 RepID=UPI00343018E5
MTPDEHFDRIAEELAPHGAVAGAMFGKRALKAQGRAFACLKGELLAVKLGDGTSAHRAALELTGAELFDPSEKGRPFKDWVAVPATHADRWVDLAGTALDTIAS